MRRIEKKNREKKRKSKEEERQTKVEARKKRDNEKGGQRKRETKRVLLPEPKVPWVENAP